MMSLKTRAVQSDFVLGSAFSALKLCLLDKNKHDGNSTRIPVNKLCLDRSIAASQSEIFDFGQNPEQMLYLVRKSEKKPGKNV